MHQESNTREAIAASMVPFAAMSTIPDDADDGPAIQPDPDSDLPLRSERPARVLTPAVERVLAWHRRHGT